MESWMVSLGIGLAAVIGSAYITRYQGTETKKIVEAHGERLDKHGDTIVELKTKSELAMTAKDVDAKYVSKELYKESQKHIDQRFDDVKGDLGKILSYIEKVK